ncbi:MAG: hypothetical protein GY850_44455 [bacterium]|nr:hypothetical protein [bacterium]
MKRLIAVVAAIVVMGGCINNPGEVSRNITTTETDQFTIEKDFETLYIEVNGKADLEVYNILGGYGEDGEVTVRVEKTADLRARDISVYQNDYDPYAQEVLEKVDQHLIITKEIANNTCRIQVAFDSQACSTEKYFDDYSYVRGSAAVSLRLDNVNNKRVIIITDGNVDCDQIVGGVIESGGYVVVEGASEPLEISAQQHVELGTVGNAAIESSGSVRIERAEGELEVKNSSSIYVDEFSGAAFDLQSNSENRENIEVTVVGDTAVQGRVEASYGNIALKISRELNADVEVYTGNGDTDIRGIEYYYVKAGDNSDDSVYAGFALNGGEGYVTAETAFGNISVTVSDMDTPFFETE